MLFTLKIDNKSEYPLIHSCLLTDVSDEENHLKIKFKEDYDKLKPLEFTKTDLKNYEVTRGCDRIIYYDKDYIISHIDASKKIDLKLEFKDEWNVITIKFGVYLHIYFFYCELERR